MRISCGAKTAVFGRSFDSVTYAISKALKNSRVDFVGVGDSNQIQSGFGWDHGFQYALSQRFQMWATGLLSFGENNFNGSAQGYLYSRVGSSQSAFYANTGAPAELGTYLDKGTGGLFPADYGYASTGTGPVGANNGMIINAGCPIDPTGPIEFDGYWGSFNTGSGSFRASARLGASPFTFIASNGDVSTNTGVLGNMVKETLAVGADASRASLQLSWNRIGTTGVAAPFFSTFMRARNTGRATGFSYSTLNFRGGQSLRTMAVDLQQASDVALTHYFSILRNDQGATKTIIICINSGLNDRNETLTSVGPDAIADGDSPEAYVDNLTAVVQRIQAIWTTNSWGQTELYWIIMPSHPISTPDDADLQAYRTATKNYSATLPRSLMIDIPNILPQTQFTSNSWYASGGADTKHLTQTGYEQVSYRVLHAFGLV